MRTSKFTVQPIAHSLERVEGEVVVGQVSRKLGTTDGWSGQSRLERPLRLG
jgi:hypothetical protein